ncbi:LLM class flavin-dependent oxidoreductase [Streptomyces sp. V4-01]|uniref:LLM class flavin-dependent oxidoreductase n=1 Tax=Actinacidiphila polyblastidii TaxID=3110430 RepID=A0ABU7PDK7_9ACTN|nr:LLM class flavin-dependent oxidoreductase [Streptomyces sp. V4-01]
MSLQPHWYLPTSGDGRDVVGWAHSRIATAAPWPTDRAPTVDYLADVARAAERLGFASVLTPAGTWCEDPWIVTAALLRETRRLRFIVAQRPDAVTPTLAAQMAATFQRVSGGRLMLNVVTGSDDEEQRRYGDWLDHDARYARTAEWLGVLRGAWSGEPFDHDGEHYRVRGATVADAPDPVPPILLGGSSEPALRTAAAHADLHLSWGEPPAGLAPRLARLREAARAAGRRLAFGVRLHVITRDSSEQAWAEAARLLRGMDPQAIALAQRRAARTSSDGQRRMTALHGGRTDRLEIAPNLWAGFGLLRRHAGTALVGSHHEVADRLAEYHALGVEHVLLSGQPHLEEAHWFGEGVLPLLRERGLLAAHDHLPGREEPLTVEESARTTAHSPDPGPDPHEPHETPELQRTSR